MERLVCILIMIINQFNRDISYSPILLAGEAKHSRVYHLVSPTNVLRAAIIVKFHQVKISYTVNRLIISPGTMVTHLKYILYVINISAATK